MLIIDPTDTSVRPLLQIVESFVVHATPIRTGLVFKVNSSKAVSGLDDAGVAMLCAFNYVQQSKGAVAAFGFLRSVIGSAEGDKVAVEDVKRELRSQFSEDPVDILDEDSDYIFGRQLSSDFIGRTGLNVFPQALVNGIPLPQAKVSSTEFNMGTRSWPKSNFPGESFLQTFTN